MIYQPVLARKKVFVQPFLVFWDLFLIQLANWRWSWQAMAINGLIVPMTTLYFLKTMGTAADQPELILSGNIIVSLIFTTMYGTSARFSFMRTFGVLDYYATLPVPKALLVLAVNAGFLVLSLPTALLTVLIGQWFLGLNLSLSPMFLVLVPLASFSLSAVGAFVGVAAPNFDAANTVTAILQFIFMGLGPVLLPEERLPAFAIFLGHFLPSTYAADALRHTLNSTYDGRFFLDLAFLIIFDLLAMVFVGYKMEWRRG
ncbi:MAG: ABC transporter permease [Chloroflexota bacterium]|nr:ABC transporter permease [Chloroflexota bacterium]